MLFMGIIVEKVKGRYFKGGEDTVHVLLIKLVINCDYRIFEFEIFKCLNQK